MFEEEAWPDHVRYDSGGGGIALGQIRHGPPELNVATILHAVQEPAQSALRPA